MKSRGKILLVEDNLELNKANARALRLRKYDVEAVLSIEEGKEYLNKNNPDIILLDVMLPDGDGFEFCETIRQKTKAHILFLTAKTERASIVKGIKSGGDDYITKPFHPEELLARIDAAMRRIRIDGNKLIDNFLELGALRIEVLTGAAFINNSNIHLTKKEFLILLILVQNKGKVVPKEMLYESIWKQPMAGDGNALWKHISRLKKKLEMTSENTISIFNSRGEGYSIELM